MNKASIIYTFLMLVFTTNSVVGQLRWPVNPGDRQHNITGSMGEYRNTNRFHQGTDITGNNYRVFAVNTGTLVVENTGSALTSYLQVGNQRYYHVQLASNSTLQNGSQIQEGQEIGVMMQEAGWPIHVHLHGNNHLHHSLHPYLDNVDPTIFEVKFRRYKESGQLNTKIHNNSEFSPMAGSTSLKIYNKVDIIARAGDKGVGPQGEANGNNIAPFMVSYRILDADGVRIGEIVENIKFANPPDNAAATTVFGMGTTFSPAVYYYNLTTHPTEKNSNNSYHRYWNTALRKGKAEDWLENQNNNARIIDEAVYPDGQYSVPVSASDAQWDAANVNTISFDPVPQVFIDNFRPYVKQVSISAGKFSYTGSWKWEEAAGQLAYKDNAPAENACGKTLIRITTSEAMKKVQVAISALGFDEACKPVEGSHFKEWEVEVPAENLKDKPEGPHKVVITGRDLADNELHGFTSKTAVSASDIPKLNGDGSWSTNPSTTDNIHEFKIVSIGKVSVSTTEVSGCNKNDGKASITASGSNLDLEYAVGGSAWQSSNQFDNLKEGEHQARVRAKGGQCEVVETFNIGSKDPLQVFISGFGTTEFCDNAQPPTVTLTATASGGTGHYKYSWPERTKTVSSTGKHSVTVIDTLTGCKKSVEGEVFFVPIICSRDPNDIVGPAGYGPSKMISKFKQHPYMIRFENDPKFATAPAQVVKINHPLHSNANLFSLRLSDFGFGGLTFKVPENRTFYSTRLDVMDSLGIVVDVTAGIDVTKKEAFWIFESKDPKTGLPPSDATLGFLPVNDSSHKGEGFVTYTIRPANHAKTGDTLYAEASIVFDLNAAIETPKIFNTIDAVIPNSVVASLPKQSDSTSIILKWTGKDEPGGSGIKDYTLYVSENGAPYTAYQTGITDTTTTYTGKGGSRYSFYTRATDNTGNTEAEKTAGKDSILLASSGIYVSVKAFLQGAYVRDSANLMTDSLRAKALLPVLEPYQAMSRFVAVGSTIREMARAGIFENTGNIGITDWVWLELRNSLNPFEVVATRSALLRRDGNVVDVDGQSPVHFKLIPEGNYYITIKHRNHFGVMTARPFSFGGTMPTKVDFTSPDTETYGSNAQRLLDGIMVMWAGDINGDGKIRYNGAANDKVQILAKVGLVNPNQIITGYDINDLNLDGRIKFNGSANDKTIILFNIGITTPNNELTEQIPK